MNFLFVLFILGCFAEEKVYDCGETANTLTCTFNPDTFTLTVSGSGKMKQYPGKWGPDPAWSDDQIKNVVIGKDVLSLCDGFCSYKSSLVSVSLEAGSKIEIIGSSAFEGCWRLTSLSFPSTLTTIGENAFAECESLAEININGEGGVYSSVDGVLLKKIDESNVQIEFFPAPKEIEKYVVPNSVTIIPSGIFKRNDHIKTIVTTNVKIIKKNAFQLSYLKTISLPNVVQIEESAFYRCNALQTVSFGSKLKTIGLNIFDSCNEIATFEMDDNNENFKVVDGILYTKDGSVLLKCPPKKQIIGKFVVPAGVKTIYDSAFNSQSTIGEVEIGNDVQTLRSKAFSSSSITKLILSSNLRSVATAAFSSCTKLESVEIGSGVKILGTTMFLSCSKLKTVIFKENSNLITIEDQAFKGTKLETVVIPDSVQYVRMNSFEEISTLKSVTIGSGVTVIGEAAFKSCSALESVTFKGTNLWRINYEAFYGTAISSINIPSSVKYIDDNAFARNSKLNSIQFNGEKQPAFCSPTAFDSDVKKGLYLHINYNQQEFCGIPTGKGKYPELPQECNTN